MSITTIPKKLAKKEDIVAIPRREYEALLKLREHVEDALELRDPNARERIRKSGVHSSDEVRNVVEDFCQTGLYTGEFLRDMESGLRKSSYSKTHGNKTAAPRSRKVSRRA